MHFATICLLARITRSKGKSDRLSLPMRMRPTRRDTASGRNGGTALSTSGWEQQRQMPTQMPHLTQLPEAASAERTATALMLPPGPHRPLTPCMPLPASPTSSPCSSAPLFQEDRYSSTSEEESEVTFTHGKNNFFMPDGSNRQIHQIDNKVFHAGYLENGNNAYLLELPALENMLNTRKFLMDEMSGQFYAVYGNSYQRMST